MVAIMPYQILKFLSNVLSYDIFEERNWEVPKTWNEVTSLVRELSISNLQFYLPVSVSGASSVVNPIFATMLFQRGEHSIAMIIKNLTLIRKKQC